jgi:hypothetical protein
MAGKSNYLENHFLEALYDAGTFTEPSTVYLALYSSDPTDADTGTELSGGNYARQALTCGTHITVSGNAATNPADIEFPFSSAAWGNAAYWGLRTASSAGSLLHYGALTPARNVDSSGIQVVIPAGDLDITEE